MVHMILPAITFKKCMSQSEHEMEETASPQTVSVTSCMPKTIYIVLHG